MIPAALIHEAYKQAHEAEWETICDDARTRTFTRLSFHPSVDGKHIALFATDPYSTPRFIPSALDKAMYGSETPTSCAWGLTTH